jgi:Mor family transcriptional regulator
LLHFVAQGMDEADAKDAARCAIARVWKGSRWYVTGQNDTSARNEAILRDYQRGDHPALLERRYGLKKVQIWRIINAIPSH